jgi:hypothetical protein
MAGKLDIVGIHICPERLGTSLERSYSMKKKQDGTVVLLLFAMVKGIQLA